MLQEANKHEEQMLRIIRINEMVIKTGISKSGIYERLNPRSDRYDECFPQPVRIGARSIGWLSSSVDEWLRSLS
ncbi:TPA: helix-turn-helix transcriptional regulator [Aeromonas veronii]